MRLVVAIFLFFTILGCSYQSEKPNRRANFTSFELSYTDGWGGRLAILVDSTGKYFSPYRFDTVRYGHLSDSVFNILISTVSKIQSADADLSRYENCYDCPILAIQTVSGDDTILVTQVNEIDTIFWRTVRSLENFLNSSEHSIIDSFVFLSSETIVFPQPPPFRKGSKEEE